MTKEVKTANGCEVTFDKSYWPDGTLVSGRPFDLKDLWDNQSDADATERFIAESIIDGEPHGHVNLVDCQQPMVEVFLWGVGRDTVCLNVPLCSQLRLSVRDYEKLCSENQADDMRKRIRRLDAVIAAAKDAQSFGRSLIDEYEAGARGK